MDYEFEAPQYVNFACAMDDEDDHDVSRYFDIEHEYNLRELRVKVNPLDILPKGARTFVPTKKPSRGGSLKCTRSSTETTVQSYHQVPSDDSVVPLSPSPRRLTRSSLKGTPIHKTPSAQYADCLTPGVKRLRSSTENTPEGTPSKRLKSTPLIVKGLASIQLSPATVTVDSLVQEAVDTLTHLSKSAKKVGRPSVRQLSVVGELKEQKDCPMETPGDKQRQAPLHLRSRSVPRSQQNLPLTTSLSKAKPDLKSRVRARSASRDRGVTSGKSKPEPDRYVSLSDVLNKIHTKSQTRFKLKKTSPSKITNGPLRPTVPFTANTERRLRSKNSSEETSTSNVKSNGSIDNVLRPLNSIEKKAPTVPAPFALTEVRKKEVTPVPRPFKFTARSVPKSVLEPSTKIATTNKGKTPTKGQTPRKTIVMDLKESNGQLVLTERDVTHVNGLKFVPTKQLTEPKPFSFEVRETERLARKNARQQLKIEAEIRGQPKFHANPLPTFPTPQRYRRSPSPMSRKPTDCTTGSTNGSTNGRTKQGAPDLKAPLAPHFRARAPVVLTKKPFEPVKPERQLPLPTVTLNSEVRAKAREEFDRKQAQKDAELQVLAKRMREEREKKEQEALARSRREVVHKARPMPENKSFETKPCQKPLTDPKTPACLKRSTLSAR